MFGFGLTGNWPQVIAELGDIGKQVLPKAIASTLTKATYDVRDNMRTYMLRAIDRPREFTLKAFKVRPARWQDGDRMKAEVYAQEKQAAYLHFLIMGGTRHPGDAGSGPANDILSWSRRPTQYGGAYAKSFVRKTSAENKAERTGRAALRQQRVAARSAMGPHRDLRWITAANNKPGTFYGTIGGIEGYWQRPARYRAEERVAQLGKRQASFDRDVGTANRLLARGRSLSTAKSRVQDAFHMHQAGGMPRLANVPWTKPGQRPKLLLAFRTTVPYRATFDYDGVMLTAYERRVNDTSLATSIRYFKSLHP